MPATIDRRRVLELVDRAAQLVEVLPKDEYDEDHRPDAINLPLTSLDATSVDVLDRSRPVILDCWDLLCAMSPRAAWRLERFGFSVDDYAPGKLDWLAAGLPTVTAGAPPRRAADRDPATCSPDTPVGALDTGPVIVVNEHHIVLGGVRAGGRRYSRQTAEDVMEPGPTTVRAHEPLDELFAGWTPERDGDRGDGSRRTCSVWCDVVHD